MGALAVIVFQSDAAVLFQSIHRIFLLCVFNKLKFVCQSYAVRQRHRKPVTDCYSMDSFACGFETRDFVPHGSCATHHASPLACVLRRTAYRQKFPISFALRACFLDFCRNTVSPRRRISSHGMTQSPPTVCSRLSLAAQFYAHKF